METEIRFLEVLEGDLKTIADREVGTAPIRARRGVTRGRWLAAAASILVLAFAVGAVAQLGGGGRQAANFSTVGSAGNADRQAPGLAPPPADNAHQAPGLPAPTYARQGNNTGGKATAGDNLPGADLTKIIRDGTIAIAVPDGSFDAKRSRVVAIAHANGGFVLTSQTQGSTTGTFTIRVPASHFDAAIGQVAELGTVESSSVTGKDVTNQYIDYQAHLKNLIGRRTVLRGLLLKTTTIGESLTVENQLQDVQLQIDQIQGELRYLNNQVEESTLTIDLREESAPAGAAETNGAIHNPSLSLAWDRAVQGFFGIIASIIIGLGYLIPVAVIAGIAYGIVTLVRRRGRAAS
jgi:Domain of unknown function (DUF4349)